ncbi:MAG: helix-turn-helix transcriptional regulator [Hydrogenophaga sp.]|nr:helix-turn-helix transcriptional regulator [Hydrogenophaga sp.]
MKTLAQRVKYAREQRSWTQSHLAAAAGLSQGTIGNIESGARQARGSLPQIAEALGVEHKWLSQGIGNPWKTRELPVAYLVGTPGSNVQAISRIRLRLHRGSAQVSVDPDESDTSPIALSKVWLEARQLDARRLMAFRLDMAGMEPSLHEGDTLIISAAHVEPQDGCVFAVNYEGELVFRRLVRDGGLWWMYADHTDQARFPRKTFDDRATLIGRVVHKLSDHI